MGGLSLILVEKTMPGVKTRHMPCSGVWASGTTYVTFEDVKVPVENIIGQAIFNHFIIWKSFTNKVVLSL